MRARWFLVLALTGALSATACTESGSHSAPLPVASHQKAVRLVVQYRHRPLTKALDLLASCAKRLPKGSRIMASTDSTRIVVTTSASPTAEPAFRACVERQGGSVAP